MKKISHFIHELGVLKRLPRSGSFIAGIKNPDTVAEHVFRATQVAFLLAELEGGNGERASFLIALHDNAEARVGDHHKIMSRYIPGKKEWETSAFYEQISGLPMPIQLKMQSAFEEFEAQKTIESICAHDADLLELAFEAKEMLEQGFGAMQDWLDNIQKNLSTTSAQKIFLEMQKGESRDWWQGLKSE